MSDTDLYLSYRLLVDDFLELCEFIAPSRNNFRAYSHRNYQLLLRIATEFENICKIVINDKLPGKPTKNIVDYYQINSLFNLHKFQAGILFGLPKKFYIRPFSQWKSDHSLHWYQAYNNVKHNRKKCFEDASFRNVLYSLAALHMVLNKQFGSAFFQPFSTNKSSGGQSDQSWSESFINGEIFSIKHHR